MTTSVTPGRVEHGERELEAEVARAGLRADADIAEAAEVAHEGAVCLEIAADHAPCADGPHPVLGVTLRRVKDEPHPGARA